MSPVYSGRWGERVFKESDSEGNSGAAVFPKFNGRLFSAVLSFLTMAIVPLSLSKLDSGLNLLISMPVLVGVLVFMLILGLWGVAMMSNRG